MRTYPSFLIPLVGPTCSPPLSPVYTNFTPKRRFNLRVDKSMELRWSISPLTTVQYLR